MIPLHATLLPMPRRRPSAARRMLTAIGYGLLILLTMLLCLAAAWLILILLGGYGPS